MNDQHRYLLQKFFNNEGTYSITLSYNKTKNNNNNLNITTNYKTHNITYFHTINNNLKLITKYNQYQINTTTNNLS